MKLKSLQTTIILFSFLLLGTTSKAQIITTVAGNNTSGYSGDLGAAISAAVGEPGYVALDGAGNLYISDGYNNVIRKVNVATGIITTYAGNGTSGFSGDLGAATSAQLSYPQGIALDTAGNLYIADDGNYVVRKVSPTGIITTFAGIAGSPGYTGDSGPATSAQLYGALGIVTDRKGNVFVSDGNYAIRKIDATGTITTYAGSLAYGYSGDGDAATLASMANPAGIALDDTGTMYIADNQNNVIRRVDTFGIITTVAGNGYLAESGGFPPTGAYAGDGGPAIDAELNEPYGVAADKWGNIYIADQSNNVIRKVNSSQIISTLVGNGYDASIGYGLYAGDGGLATNAALNYPQDIIVDTSGNLYIADLYNYVVRKVAGISILTATDTVCSGVSVTYTAVATAAGSAVGYQWKLNGTNVGTDSTIYTADSVHNGDIISCQLVNLSGNVIDISDSIIMVVTTSVFPSVSIAASTSYTVCAGTSVTYSATPANGGTTPLYQWKVNGINTGTGATYAYTPVSGDIITCELTSNANCLIADTAVSSPVAMSVTPLITPVVSIATASTGSTICEGSTVSYTATPTNGGTTPTYQWRVNGINTGTGSTYSYTPANGDIVTSVLTSDAACTTIDTALSPSITMTITPTAIPSVSTEESTSGSICEGTSVTYSATPVNGGASPTYQWKVNGTNASTGTSYTYTPANGDLVTCVITSDAACASPDTAVSTAIAMTVTATVVPEVLITASPSTTVTTSGETITFTAAVVNGGSTPTYQWYINGTAITGATSATFAVDSFTYADTVYCTVTSNANCASPATVTSNSKNIIISLGVPQISGTANNIILLPNPNNGTFTIKGNLGTGADEAANIVVTDMLGRIVYHTSTTTQQGAIDSQVILSGDLSNGVYLINIMSGNSQTVIHFVIEK